MPAYNFPEIQVCKWIFDKETVNPVPKRTGKRSDFLID